MHQLYKFSPCKARAKFVQPFIAGTIFPLLSERPKFRGVDRLDGIVIVEFFSLRKCYFFYDNMTFFALNTSGKKSSGLRSALFDRSASIRFEQRVEIAYLLGKLRTFVGVGDIRTTWKLFDDADNGSLTIVFFVERLVFGKA